MGYSLSYCFAEEDRQTSWDNTVPRSMLRDATRISHLWTTVKGNLSGDPLSYTSVTPRDSAPQSSSRVYLGPRHLAFIAMLRGPALLGVALPP